MSLKSDGSRPYLSDFLKEFETNTIYDKCIPGNGGTTLEMMAPRSSILILPCVQAIVSKARAEYPANIRVLGVCKQLGTRESVIHEHIMQAIHDNAHIKILTTPESFDRVAKAFAKSPIDMYSSVFCLIDEIDRNTEDADYRATINYPLNDFFNFAQKAVISATPHEMSDPRFRDWTLCRIQPQWDTTITVNLRITNNLLQEVKKRIEEVDADRRIFMFFNSVTSAMNLLQQLDIVNSSAIFCSQKRYDEEKRKKEYSGKIYGEYREDLLQRVNIMTCRYYQAFDIILDEQPDVFILSDTSPQNEQTLVDPATNVIQIAGRFRRGFHALYHITTVSQRFNNWSEEAIQQYVIQLEAAWRAIYQIYQQTTIPEVREAMAEYMRLHPFASMVNDVFSYSYQACDNEVWQRRKKGYYRSGETLEAAYKTVDGIKFETCYSNHASSAEKLRRCSRSKNKAQARREILAELDALGDTPADETYKEDLRQEDDIVVEAWEKLDRETLLSTSLTDKALSKAIMEADFESGLRQPTVINLVKSTFHEGDRIYKSRAKQMMKEIYQRCHLDKGKTVTFRDLEPFFVLSEGHDRRGDYVEIVAPRM